jgi:hypothetical protein
MGVKMNTAVEFACPECGDECNIVEISIGIFKENFIDSFGKTDDGDVFCEYGKTEYNQEDEEVSCFCCENCSERITDESGEPITDPKDLYQWLNRKDMLRPPDTEI